MTTCSGFRHRGFTLHHDPICDECHRPKSAHVSERVGRSEDDDEPSGVVSTLDTDAGDDVVTPLSVAGMLWNADVADTGSTYSSAPAQQGSSIGDALGGLVSEIGSRIPHVDVSPPQNTIDTSSSAPATDTATPTPAPTPTVDYSTPTTYDAPAPPAPDTSSFS